MNLADLPRDAGADTILLLGAGASAEAGIPTARELTHVLITMIESEGALDVVKALRYVQAGLHFMEGRRGHDPAVPVDIEQLLNALELLANREDLEIAPFVTWDRFIDTLNVDLGSFRYKQVGDEIARLIKEALRPTSAQHKLPTTAFEDALYTAVSQHSFLSAFYFAKGHLLRALVKTVWRDSYDNCTYLLPALNSLTVRAIATLNYDNVVESAAATRGISIETCIELWSAGQRDFAKSVDARHLLLKLHGSANWFWSRRDEDSPEQIVSVDPSREPLGGLSSPRPVLLFGGRVKLTARGPFLDLLFAFRRELEHASRVVAVGYSFRDEHVDEYLLAWLRRDPDATLYIIDPHLTRLEDRFRSDHRLRPVVRQMRLRPESASSGLRSLFGDPNWSRV